MTSSSWTPPTFAAEQARILTDLSSVPAALSGPLSGSWARSCFGMYGMLGFILDQANPLTCGLDALADWAALYNVPQLPAFSAFGNVLATGVAGTPVLAGTLIRGSNGLNYSVNAAVNLGSGSTSIAVTCQAAGAASNLAPGQVLQLINPIAGIANQMTVDPAGLTGGADAEGVDSWRARVAAEWQQMVTFGARAGKPADYVYWAKSAHPSVSSALVQPQLLGYGTVVVSLICNSLPNRLPSAGVIAAVQSLLAVRAPATADWSVIAPSLDPVSISISLQAPANTAANENAINAALSALIFSKVDNNAILLDAEINAAIATVTTQYTLLAPTVDLTAPSGSIFVLNHVGYP